MKKLWIVLVISVLATVAAAANRPGLVLRDTGRGIMNAMAHMGGKPGQRVDTATGFWVEVYTLQSWVDLHKAWAAEEYREFVEADITDEMREPVLRIIVHPDLPNTFDAQAMASSVKHVVLRSTLKEAIAVQPLTKEPFAEVRHGQRLQTAGGAVLEYSGVIVTFSLDALASLRSADKQAKGEFIITVVGEGSKKDFKVKTKHFDRLPGLAPSQGDV